MSSCEVSLLNPKWVAAFATFKWIDLPTSPPLKKEGRAFSRVAERNDESKMYSAKK